MLAIAGTSLTRVSEDEQTLHNVTATLGGLPFASEGLYEFEVMLDGKPLASKPLPVISVPTEEGGISGSSAAE